MADEPTKRQRLERPTDVEYRFKIDVYTPNTIPMARLAEYMTQLAVVLGEPSAVHFVRLAVGSTIIVHRVDREAAPKVRERAIAVRRGNAPRDAWRGYQNVNRLLREDAGVGLLVERAAKPTTPVVLKFPGREEVEEKFPSVRQQGSIDGELMKIGGIDDTISIILKSENVQITGCWTTRTIARQLARHLFEDVRVFGYGRWSRDADLKWTLQSFKVESFIVLNNATLVDALEEIRKVALQWKDDAYGELEYIRSGEVIKSNGSH